METVTVTDGSRCSRNRLSLVLCALINVELISAVVIFCLTGNDLYNGIIYGKDTSTTDQLRTMAYVCIGLASTMVIAAILCCLSIAEPNTTRLLINACTRVFMLVATFSIGTLTLVTYGSLCHEDFSFYPMPFIGPTTPTPTISPEVKENCDLFGYLSSNGIIAVVLGVVDVFTLSFSTGLYYMYKNNENGVRGPMVVRRQSQTGSSTASGDEEKQSGSSTEPAHAQRQLSETLPITDSIGTLTRSGHSPPETEDKVTTSESLKREDTLPLLA